MFVRKVHSVIGIFLMALLITAKFAAYHSLSHEDDCVECCSFCENVMVIGQTPAVVADAVTFDEPHLPIPPRENPKAITEAIHYPEIAPSSLFSRPPPVL